MACRPKTHVAIFAFPFGTHAPPLLSLAQKLAELAPGVAFSFFSTSKSNASLRSSPSIPNLKVYDVADGLPEGYASSGNVEEEIELFLRATPGNFGRALERAVGKEEGKLSCVVSDAFLWLSGQIAEEVGVPWVAAWLASVCSLSVHVSTDLIRRTVGTQSEEVLARLDQPLSFIPGLAQFRVRDSPDGIVSGHLDSLFSTLLHRMGKEMPRAAIVIINTLEVVEPTFVLDELSRSLQKCLPVGPLTLLSPIATEPDADPHNCLTWLDAWAHAPASVAYVAFGSVMPPPPPELAQLAQGLEASGTHFLWSLKDRFKEGLPDGFLERTRERGLVVPWAPQSRVLGHVAVGAFLTHCGWNSVMESIAGGVPMICRPMFGDQRMNGRLASHVLGIAIEVECGELTKDAVVDGLDLLLRREEGEKIREKVGSLKVLGNNAVGDNGWLTQNLKTVIEIATNQ